MWSSCISDLLLYSPTYFAIFWYSWYVRKLQYNDIKANEINDVKKIKAQKVKQKQKKHTMKQMSIKSRLLRGFKGKKGISFP